MALAARGSYQEAIGHFEQALDLDPTAFRARYNLAGIYKQTRRTEQAIGQLRKPCG